MHQVLELLEDNMYVVVVALISLAAVCCGAIKAVTTVLTTNARERSRREIAAFIADGSLSPEQGERLLRADVNAEMRHRV